MKIGVVYAPDSGKREPSMVQFFKKCQRKILLDVSMLMKDFNIVLKDEDAPRRKHQRTRQALEELLAKLKMVNIVPKNAPHTFQSWRGGSMVSFTQLNRCYALVDHCWNQFY